MAITLSATKSSDDNFCYQDAEWCTSRVLSQEATKEILGENLSALIAISKDHKPVVYLPYGAQISMDDHSHSEVETLLEFAVKVPVEEAPFSELNYTLCYPKMASHLDLAHAKQELVKP